MDEKEKLVEKIKKIGWETGEVVVSLEDFFEGNPEEFCNISVNVYPDCPTTENFYKTMLSIRNMENVQDVLIRIVDIDEPDWPTSDTVYIITHLTIEKIKERTKTLEPDSIDYGWGEEKTPINSPKLEKNMNIIALWWD